MLFPDGQTRSYQYDPNGNQAQLYNGLTTTTYTYDADDQLTKIDYPTLADTTFTYYKDGRTESMTDSQGVTTWFYDANGRTTTLNTPQGNLTYLYDTWGRRTQLGQGGTNKILYSYTGDKLTGILKQPENENTVLHYDAYGRMDRETFANGAYSTYGFDLLDRLTGISHKNAAGTVLGSESYDLYDEVSNLLQKTIDGVVSSYVYDDADQLTSETISGVTTGYSYDANGNRVSRTQIDGPDSYTYDDGDKLITLNGVVLPCDAAGDGFSKETLPLQREKGTRLS